MFVLEIFSPFWHRKEFFQNLVKDVGSAGLRGEGDFDEKHEGAAVSGVMAGRL